MVNSSYGDLVNMMNEVGNILDSLYTNIFMCMMREKEIGYKEPENNEDEHEKCLNAIADEVEFQLMNYLIEKYGAED